MKRRQFLLITTGAVASIIGIGSIIKKTGNSILPVANKFQDVGFSIKCGLALPANNLQLKLAEAPYEKMEFDQILIDRIYLNEAEFIYARNIKTLKPSGI